MSTKLLPKFIPISLSLLASSVILFEIALTRIFAVTLFANYAHIVLGLGMFGFSIGALLAYYYKSDSSQDLTLSRISVYFLIQSLMYFLVTVISLNLQIFSEATPATFSYQSRESDLLYGWTSFNLYLLFVSVLAVFSTAGAIICLIFKYFSSRVGLLYGYDLIGAGIGSIIFIPLSLIIAAPDLAIICSFLCCVGGYLLAFNSAKSQKIASAVAVLIFLILTIQLFLQKPFFTIKHAAGLPESSVKYQEWTPISRLTIHNDSRKPGREIMVFDSASVSMIVKSDDHRKQITKESTRSLVYSLVPQNSRVAILAASAGPEIVAAQTLGLWDITAIDINARAFQIIAERYKDYRYNPFLSPQLKTINADGRAAIRHSKLPYDVIHMVHANLWSLAGLLANAWSPWMLSTKEAFSEYLDKLTPHGILSFSRGFETEVFIPSLVAALEERGVINPYNHIAFLGGSNFTLLVRPKPWTDQQIQHLEQTFKSKFGRDINWYIHPKQPHTHTSWNTRWFTVMTDDRPYPERGGRFIPILQKLLWRLSNKTPAALVTDGVTLVYVSIIFQAFFALTIGLFTVLPVYIFSRKIKDLGDRFGTALYFSSLGLGYISVQILLVQRLILFIGHPTYALCIVIGAMLVFSGIGSLLSDKIELAKLKISGICIFFFTLLLGIVLSSSIGPAFIQYYLSELNLAVRCIVAVITVGIGSILLGIPFPLRLKELSGKQDNLSPFAWAFNGWFSIIGGVLSIILSRQFGYVSLMYVALICYLIVGIITLIYRSQINIRADI